MEHILEYEELNEDIKGILVASAIGIGIVSLIGWAIYANNKMKEAIQKMITDEFSTRELIEIKKTLDRDPHYRRYRRDMEAYKDLHYKSRLVSTGNQSMDQFKDVMADIYADHVIRDLKYKIEDRAQEILPGDYYDRIVHLDNKITKRYGCTSEILY